MVTVQLTGEHDVSTNERVEAAILAAQQLGDRVLVDLSAVTFIDASTIDIIVRAHTRRRGRCRSVRVVRPTKQTMRIFSMLELEAIVRS